MASWCSWGRRTDRRCLVALAEPRRYSSCTTIPCRASRRGRAMDLLEQAASGFRGVAAPDEYKQQALRYLRQWLSEPEFATYRPQLTWLIESGQWPGLLDR